MRQFGGKNSDTETGCHLRCNIEKFPFCIGIEKQTITKTAIRNFGAGPDFNDE
jgi:hypothetical protein